MKADIIGYQEKQSTKTVGTWGNKHKIKYHKPVYDGELVYTGEDIRKTSSRNAPKLELDGIVLEPSSKFVVDAMNAVDLESTQHDEGLQGLFTLDSKGGKIKFTPLSQDIEWVEPSLPELDDYIENLLDKWDRIVPGAYK